MRSEFPSVCPFDSERSNGIDTHRPISQVNFMLGFTRVNGITSKLATNNLLFFLAALNINCPQVQILETPVCMEVIIQHPLCVQKFRSSRGCLKYIKSRGPSYYKNTQLEEYKVFIPEAHTADIYTVLYTTH